MILCKCDVCGTERQGSWLTGWFIRRAQEGATGESATLNHACSAKCMYEYINNNKKDPNTALHWVELN
jgi:hypothetical protein